jgi:hypothetical protein
MRGQFPNVFNVVIARQNEIKCICKIFDLVLWTCRKCISCKGFFVVSLTMIVFFNIGTSYVNPSFNFAWNVNVKMRTVLRILYEAICETALAHASGTGGGG